MVKGKEKEIENVIEHSYLAHRIAGQFCDGTGESSGCAIEKSSPSVLYHQ